MKQFVILLSIFCIQFGFSQAKKAKITNAEYRNQLDLKVISELFENSEDLEDFERQLNDDENQVSNLDLNKDSFIDYLRVVEQEEKRKRFVVIQSVIGKNLYQEVAKILIEKKSENNIRVRIIGHRYIYGNPFYYDPVFVNQPRIFAYYQRPNRLLYNSRYYWGYYPDRFIVRRTVNRNIFTQRVVKNNNQNRVRNQRIKIGKVIKNKKVRASKVKKTKAKNFKKREHKFR